MKYRNSAIISFLIIAFVFVVTVVTAQTGADSQTYMPIVLRPLPTPTFTPTPTPSPTPSPTPPPPGTQVEVRALWVTRFDWTSDEADINPAKIDEIVNNAAYAGFNTIYFQVRGEADAFYQSNVEPWSQRLTGTLGQNPGWDPLAYMIDRAHAQGIQVHAYINVYPVWLGCTPPADGTTPRHLYYQLRALGTSNGKPNHLQWDTGNNVLCGSGHYMRSSPASIAFDDHILNVATDLVTRYDVDGIHLDHIRYGGANSSCDPVSESSYGANCFGSNGQMSYEDWQRTQVNGTVWKFYSEIVPLKEDLWLSAAVWPVYIDYWGWGSSQGYHDYYQDSKAWMGAYGGGGYIDSISPMIYGSSFWTQSVWETLVQDYQNDSNGRYVIPGIHGNYDSFHDIEWRINRARQIGTAGHALFAYGYLLEHAYFDDLRNGPYANPAVVPDIPWHP